MSQLPFIVDAFGRFGPDELEVVWRDEPRPSVPELDALIEATWQQALAEAQRDGRVLFNGELTRLLRMHQEDGTLRLEVGPTNYAEFMGTNFLNPHRAAEFGWERFSNPIGTSATIITADGWLVFGRRNQRVACLPGYVHTFGGGLEQRERRADGTFDAFASVMRELNEELGLRPGDLRELACVALLRDTAFLQPELLFEARTTLTREDLADRIDPSDPDEEHDALVTCQAAPEAALPFIRQTERLAAVGCGAVLLYGCGAFGTGWYERTCSALTVG